MTQLTILPFKKKIDMQSEETVMQALRRGGYEIEGPCNGQGICGKCKIRVEASTEVPQTPHRSVSEIEAREQGVRLACRMIPAHDITVHLPDDFSVDARILEGEHLGGIEIKPAAVVIFNNDGYWMTYAGGKADVILQKWEQHFSPKGLAIDVGTTTLVVTLFCLVTGKELATASSINPQTKFGHDVLSRIQKGSTAVGLAEVAGVVREELNRLIRAACKQSNAATDELLDAVIGGNTTMLTLAAAIDPQSLGRLPFTVNLTGGASYAARDFGLDMNPAGRVYVPPIVHAFIGSDITAGVLACGCLEKAKPSLFVDVGTNGEMGINSNGRFIVASTAAGPAFEGMGVSSGVRAVPGAVEAAHFDGQSIDIKTIDGQPARGICGSGIIDMAAALLRAGVVDPTGKMTAPDLKDGLKAAVAEQLQLVDNQPVFKIADGVCFTQGDIRQVQLAKGAIRTGIDMLLTEANVTVEDLEDITLAGAFGYHLRPDSLAAIGLIPEELSRKVRFAGNTSKTGCAMMLLDASLRKYLETRVQSVEHLPLAEKISFQELFIENLNFPASDDSELKIED
ncbi:MAG: ASKHA domain-containing protein [Desulfobacterales bacterium]|jgi:uncharacterized 2Fe-2S/4Fe-4S cluster protein (DUF4445 family)